MFLDWKNQHCENVSQRLLIPVTLELTRAEMVFVRKNGEALEKIGFEAEPFGANTIKLNAIPAVLSQDSSGQMFIQEQLEQGGDRIASAF